MLLLMLCYCYFQVDACCKTSELGKVMVFDLGFFWPMFYRYEFLGFENVFWKLQVVSLHLLGIEFSCVIPLLSCSLHAFSTLRRSKLKWLAQNGGDPYSALLPSISTNIYHGVSSMRMFWRNLPKKKKIKSGFWTINYNTLHLMCTVPNVID